MTADSKIADLNVHHSIDLSLIEDIVRSLDSPTSSSDKLTTRSNCHSGLNSPSGVKEKRKCAYAFVGSPNTDLGRCTFINQRRCSTLKCLKCDYRVVFFDNMSWDTSCNYLFFRNNYPCSLASKMIRTTGCTAYCCQCSWINVTRTQKVSVSAISPSWICGGHLNM